MKIETVQWKWAEDVKRKEVYRDDEFIRSQSKEEALLAIDFLMEKRIGLTYTITVQRDGEFFTYYRHSMPCYGGFVKYRDSHGERHFMNPYFPRDLRVAFPDGDVIYIACYVINIKKEINLPYKKFIFSQESPWVSAFGKIEDVIFCDNYIVLTNMNTDPTLFYSMIRQGGLVNSHSGSKFNPKAEILFMKNFGDPRRIAGQKPIRTSGGTWAEGYGYTRPYNESIFRLSLPCKASEFGTLPTTEYPKPCPVDDKYLTTTMKEVFSVDVSNLRYNLNLTDELEKTLILAWDYFKEMSKQLDE
jgi:hypothetical protein